MSRPARPLSAPAVMVEPVAPERLSAQAVDLFTDRWGGVPDGVWLAPGRANVIGEHIDYLGGRVMPLALPYTTAVAVRLRDDDRIRLASTGASSDWEGGGTDIGPGRPSGWAGYAAGVPWAMAFHATVARVPGLDVAVASCVPKGAGLSSSAALECAIALAVAELFGAATDDIGRRALARDCVTAENVVVGAATGGMDQSVALRSLPGHVMVLDCTDFTAEHLEFDCAAAGLTLLVINTNTPRRLVDGSYGRRRSRVEAAAARIGMTTLRGAVDIDAVLDSASGGDPGLRRPLRHALTEMRRVDAVADLLRAGTMVGIGDHLSASHASLRDDCAVSTPELDVAVDAAVCAGALGARMMGGGFGGSALALVHTDRLAGVTEAVARAARDRRFAAPEFLHATPSAAARRS